MEKKVNSIEDVSNYQCTIRQLEKLLENKTKQLEEVTQELNDITFSISHDLKAPIRAIAGFSAILKEEQHKKLDGEGKRIIGVITNNVAKLTGMLNEIIDYSAISKKSLQLQLVDMKVIATEAINIIMKPEEKSLFTIITDDLDNCDADEKMMAQLWLNLANIAVLYAEKNAYFKMHIGGSEDDSTFTYYIKVSPVGSHENEPGTAKKMEANIISHQQLESNGTGAAFIKRVLFKHGGNFWIQSLPSVECAFYFSIPKSVTKNIKPVNVTGQQESGGGSFSKAW